MKATRREFLHDAALAGMTAMFAGRVGSLAAAQAGGSPWRSRIGLELYTVRDLLAADFEGTLAKVAAIGYTEVEPASGYNNMSPKDFRAMLDRLGLSMPSTHLGASGAGLELEKPLEGFQTMGIKYTEISAGGGRRGGAAGGGPAPVPGADRCRPGPTTTPGPASAQLVHRSRGLWTVPAARDARVGQTARRDLNANGQIAQKFGMKMLVHNHTGEFEKLTDSPRTTYEVLIEETDPALVTMQLDLGWIYVAGVDPIALFKKYPGRFELWHIKDVFGLKKVNPTLGPNARVSSMTFVPVGIGHIDFKPLFAKAALAGLKHFVIEQDNAASWGDSLAAARVSYQNMRTVLS